MASEESVSPTFGDLSGAVELVVRDEAEAHEAEMPIDEAPSERVICETLQLDTLHAFKAAARSLKAAEDALIAARQVYAEAVKALSEEAVG